MKRYIVTVENSSNTDAPAVAVWHSKESAQAVADQLSKTSNAKHLVVELPERVV